MIIGVFENEENTKAIIRNQLLQFSYDNNIDFDILWFDETFKAEHLKKYIGSMCFSLVSLDNNNFDFVGRIISKYNPMCYICYYSKNKKELHPLLKTRPYEYLLTSLLKEKVATTLHEIYESIMCSNCYYKYNAKSVSWCFPIRSITAFQSDLKYVFVINDAKKEVKIRTTLDMVEKDLTHQEIHNQFVRIHKSYLINIGKIRKIDKNMHSVEMDNGTIFPISDAQYNRIISLLSKMNTAVLSTNNDTDR